MAPNSPLRPVWIVGRPRPEAYSSIIVIIGTMFAARAGPFANFAESFDGMAGPPVLSVALAETAKHLLGDEVYAR